jgi:hypothetical protein
LDFAKSLRQWRKKEIQAVSKAVEFDDTDDEVMAEMNETVTLQCAVKNLGNNIVSCIHSLSSSRL